MRADPACAELRRAEFVAWCFSGGEDSRRHRNRADTIDGVAVESDNSEDKDNEQKRRTHVHQ
jgi:hypothetical protein